MEAKKKEGETVRKCKWCPNEATQSDYREVDGVTSKIATCKECFGLSTKYLLQRRYGKIE